MAISDIAVDFSWCFAAYTSFACWLVYAVCLGIYRLYYSPIAHLPGPKLAALTQYYEFYYDIILGGQYTFRIVKMHEQYGPVIRISPWEVHVSDHDFHPELYAGPHRRRHKWIFWAKQFGAPHSGLSTLDHDHHRLRRNPLNQFFSTKSVRDLQPILEERVDRLLGRLRGEAQSRPTEPIDVMYPFSAYTNDVINEYAFARSDHLIEEPDFGAHTTDSLLKGTHMGPIIKHMNWALTLVNALPESISGWDGWLKLKNDILQQIDEIKSTQGTKRWELDVSHPTIFHELLASNELPAIEKETPRLAQDGQILVQGGTLTTSWTLSLAVFHLCNRPETLTRLRDELFAAIPNRDEVVPLARLESLPYLRAVVKEALRHGVGTSSRLSRIAPDESFDINDPATGHTHHIPAGTVVSMSPYRTIMNEAIFPDPLGFHPERWLNEDERLDSYLIMFGGGTRVCLGQALAQAELHLMLAKLFRCWGSGGVVGGDLKGDRRDGDIGSFRIFETTPRDCQMASDYFIPIPYKGSKGLRFLLEAN
ncbi:Cytochrome P450 [Cordyceps fumosorosea ARSEF 2679]|uniref:Cytochrome P450 n=1 Tax=Cordyceps fumosorosea (strain ARSEF 2679) TaxID=1081104 RepID=A0A167NMF5_CORFA|nr:Cytochrome P450 [Cordyceps fumosorosea ARSEF 2679]OAA55716.1 Cytochrome P450 [Cordyceps fumosorosea ARSEF 2679]